MTSRSGGSKNCRWIGPHGETCKESRDGTKPASVKPCPNCKTRVLCRKHCGCEPIGRSVARGASSLGITVASAPSSSSASAQPQPQQQQRQQQQPQREPTTRQRSRSKEGRKYERRIIEGRLISQWRFLDISERPLPGPGRGDSGVVGYGKWADGLRGAARERTLELLATNSWKEAQEHSSVHLSLYLRWAEGQLNAEEEAKRRQESTRMGALDLGRHIQGFLS